MNKELSSLAKYILIVEDHPLSALGVELLVNRAIPKCQTRIVGNFGDMVSACQQREIDLVFLDLQIPGGVGKEMIAKLRKHQPDIRILVHSGKDELTYAPSALSYGANGFISKSATSDEVIHAMQTVLTGGKYISNLVRESILSSYIYSKKPFTNPLDLLSPRESEVLKLLMKGLGTKEISGNLDLKYSTVSTHKDRIFQKIGVSNIVDLIKKVEKFSW